jgi:hypothetical protein
VQALIDQNGGTKIDFTVEFDCFKTDPIFGYRKCLDVELYPETNPNLIITLGQREGQPFKFSF